MAVVVVVGAQWGDEGKGKVVDHYAEGAAYVVRFGGGANAGHTLVKDGQTLVTHLIPSGVLHEGKICVLGDGMVIDPDTLLEEITQCKERGLLAPGSLVVSRAAHVILPYHRMIEGLREAGPHAIGTTKRGIGPAYEAKAARRGVRMSDLLDRDKLAQLVERNLGELRPLVRHYGGEPPTDADVQKMIDSALRAGEELAPVLGDTGRLVDDAIERGENVLLEGAQGALLDLDHGTYPFVTSSSTIAAGASQGVGIGPTKIDRVIGITKAYCTRVGGGPFPTEMSSEVAAKWRDAGAEFGATTGRPRRCGWLDVPALRRAIRINGIESLALTKLDILAGRGPIELCVGYEIDGDTLDELPGELETMAKARPIFRTMEGWEPTPQARKLVELAPGARAYIDALEELTRVPFSLISVGPERTETLALKDPFAAPGL